jgi:4-amino-4-deoxy-L-arabinose transferase-like glycosyltransferase
MSRRAELAAVLALCLIGLALRTVQIDYNFDGDELFSAQLASQPFGAMVRHSLKDTPHPPLHNLLLCPWLWTFGAGEVSARSFSVLCSTAFLIVAHRLLRRLMPPGPAIGGLAILAISPFFVYYGQQARPYSLIALVSAANLLAFVRLLDTPGDRRRVIAWWATCAVLAWAQYLGILSVAVEIIVLLLKLPRSDKVIVLGGTLSVVTVLPWVIAAMGSMMLRRVNPLPTIAWIEPPTLPNLVWFYAGVFGDVPGVHSRLLLLPLAVLGVAFYSNAIRSRRSRSASALTALTGIAVGVPLAVFALSVFGPKSVWATRQLIGPALAFVSLVGLWVANCPRWLGAAVLAGVVVWSGAAVPSAFPVHSKPPWQAVAHYLDVEYPNRPVLATENWVFGSLGYYRRVGEVITVRSNPSQPVLLLCRPGRDDGLAHDSTQLRTWSWGRAHNTEGNGTMRLYEVRNCNSDPPGLVSGSCSLSSVEIDRGERR